MLFGVVGCCLSKKNLVRVLNIICLTMGMLDITSFAPMGAEYHRFDKEGVTKGSTEYQTIVYWEVFNSVIGVLKIKKGFGSGTHNLP